MARRSISAYKWRHRAAKALDLGPRCRHCVANQVRLKLRGAMLQQILDQILSAPAWAVYLVVGLLVFAEDALFVGFVLPGETAAVLGGVAASRGHVDVFAMCLIVVGAAIIGDSVGYAVGRHFGPRVLQVRL